MDWVYVFKLTTTKVVATSTKKRATPYSNRKKYLTYEEVVGAGLRTMRVCFCFLFLRVV